NVGDHLGGVTYSPAQIAKLGAGATDPGAPAGPKLRFDVVGIVRRPVDLGRATGTDIPIRLTPAFDRRYATSVGMWGTALLVQTQHGARDFNTVEGNARQLFGQSPGFSVSSLADQNNGAQSAIDVLAIALWICAAVAALAGVTVLAIVLGRE